MTQSRQPIFNVPRATGVLVFLLIGVHLAREFVLSDETDLWLLLRFAFIPARYGAGALPGGGFPGGLGADLWTFVTYALLHADFAHLGVNSVWLLAFGVPVERRFGAGRFVTFLAVAAAAGAAAHLLRHSGTIAPLVGASAAISGAMAGAIRFAFQRAGPLGWRGNDPESYRVPAQPLSQALRNGRILAFLGVWFAVNLIFGIGSLTMAEGQTVAWEAHVGGFLAGLLLFGMFDPVAPQAPAPDPQPD